MEMLRYLPSKNKCYAAEDRLLKRLQLVRRTAKTVLMHGGGGERASLRLGCLGVCLAWQEAQGARQAGVCRCRTARPVIAACAFALRVREQRRDGPIWARQRGVDRGACPVHQWGLRATWRVSLAHATNNVHGTILRAPIA